MFPKILQRIGLIACIVLVVACFMPWAYYADINETFTGFYSYQNQYGKPGKFLTLVGVVAFVFMYIPKVWAKRINLFVGALALGYAIKSYILFTSCYNAYCPEKQPGIFIMIVSCILILFAAIFPDMKIEKAPKK